MVNQWHIRLIRDTQRCKTSARRARRETTPWPESQTVDPNRLNAPTDRLVWRFTIHHSRFTEIGDRGDDRTALRLLVSLAFVEQVRQRVLYPFEIDETLADF